MSELRCPVILPRQSEATKVFTFAATASEIARFARVQRAGRDGAGIIAMGYVMEELVAHGAEEREAFARGLRLLKGRTAWCEGEWQFGDERRRWNGLQNVPADVRQLSLHLVQELRRARARQEIRAA